MLPLNHVTSRPMYQQWRWQYTGPRTSNIAEVLTATCVFAALSPVNRWLHQDEEGTHVKAPGHTHPRVWRRRQPGQGGRVPLLYGFQVILGLLRRDSAQTLQNI